MVGLIGQRLQLVKDVAAPGDEQLDAGDRPIQLRSDLDELPGHQSPVGIHPADIREDGPGGVQPELPDDPLPRNSGGELLCIDAVDGHRDMLRGQTVLPDQVLLDILGHRHGPLAPVGQIAQDAAGIKDPVGSGHKGEPHPFLQAAAQERRDPGMGMDHVRPLPANDVTENGPGTAHLPKAPAVHGRLVVADAGRLDLRHIDTSIGYDDNIVPLVLQLLGQLQDMCLRPTDVHGGHEDLHWVPPLQVIFNRWLPLFR